MWVCLYLFPSLSFVYLFGKDNAGWMLHQHIPHNYISAMFVATHPYIGKTLQCHRCCCSCCCSNCVFMDFMHLNWKISNFLASVWDFIGFFPFFFIILESDREREREREKNWMFIVFAFYLIAYVHAEICLAVRILLIHCAMPCEVQVQRKFPIEAHCHRWDTCGSRCILHHRMAPHCTYLTIIAESLHTITDICAHWNPNII